MEIVLPFEYSITAATDDSVLIRTSPYLRGIKSCSSYGIEPFVMVLLLLLLPGLPGSFAVAAAVAVAAAAAAIEWTVVCVAFA